MNSYDFLFLEVQSYWLCAFRLWLFVYSLSTYQGIPEQVEVPPVARAPASGLAANSPAQPPQPAQPAPVPLSGPNANPLDLFPQVDGPFSFLVIYIVNYFGDNLLFVGNRACQTWVQMLRVQAHWIFFATVSRHLSLSLSLCMRVHACVRVRVQPPNPMQIL